MTILLTGGTGFIGSHLVRKLVKLDHTVILLKRISSDLWRLHDVLDRVKCIDIDSQGQWKERAFSNQKIDLLIHCAATYIKSHGSVDDVRIMTDANVTWPALLLDMAYRHGVTRVLNTGSFFVYKPTRSSISERSFISPINYYAATKLAFETLLSYYTDHHAMTAVTLRLFYPYGEMDNQKLMVLLMKSIRSNTPFNLTHGEQKLNFTYVSDIVEAYVRSIEYLDRQNTQGHEIMNIGQTESVTIRDVVSILVRRDKNAKNIHLGAVPYPPGEIMFAKADIAKAKRLLGWKPTISIEEGLTKMYNYYQQHEFH